MKATDIKHVGNTKRVDRVSSNTTNKQRATAAPTAPLRKHLVVAHGAYVVSTYALSNGCFCMVVLPNKLVLCLVTVYKYLC